uniref:Neprosin PEP catalytic domain-containing protein n=1 Tax=Brassica oleracea TaxID=3712 RepID=A0A3P6G8N7_BRAOL|nr:unnamed protein product [Brassica oleracea]
MEGSKTRKLVAGYHHGPWYSRTGRLLAGTTLHPPDRVCRKVEWGGEIVNGHSLGRNTSTQMGSGCLSCGIRKAAYMSNLQIALSEKNFEPVQDLALAATSPDYRAKKLNNTFFYYGGPEQIKSGGANLMLNHIFMYLGFLLFLLV